MSIADKKKAFLSYEIAPVSDFSLPETLYPGGKQMIHFVGVGGIGMSGLASIFMSLGYAVSGSDIASSKYLKALEDNGAKVYIGHESENIADVAALVVSTAISPDNPEVKEALSRNIPIFHRGQILKLLYSGNVSGQPSAFTTIGVTGTHGKTTTSAMLGVTMEQCAQDPTVVVGGIIPQLQSNAKYGKGPCFVAELDESDGTIVLYKSDITIITNLELDHHDHYKGGMEELLQTFLSYINSLSAESTLVVNLDCPGNRSLLDLIERKDLDIVTYSTDFTSAFHSSATFKAANITLDGFNSSFDVLKEANTLGQATLCVPGEHNISNAMAVIVSCLVYGLAFEDITSCLTAFKGVNRRFQLIGECNNIHFYDDYAHHPTEIKKTLAAARDIINKRGKGRVIAIFQPHRYSRLSSLWHDFRASFMNADKVYVTEVYAASEPPIDGIDSVHFTESLLHADAVCVLGSMEQASALLENHFQPEDLVITLGAGDITKLGGLILGRLNT